MAAVPSTNLSAWLIDILQMDSVRKWHCFSDIIELFAYSLYGITKCVLVILIARRWFQTRKNKTRNCCTKLKKVNAQLTNSLFSAPTGFVSTKDMSQKNNTPSNMSTSADLKHVADAQANNEGDDSNIPKVYINDHEASDTDVAILAMVALTMLLVVISTFWYHLWIRVDIIDTCRNDSGIQCYPHKNNQLDYDHPYIQNCEQWENQVNVKFHCFRFALNFDKTFIVLGSFVSLFLRVSRNGPKILLACVTCLNKTKCCSWCFCCDNFNCNKLRDLLSDIVNYEKITWYLCFSCCDDSRSELSCDYCFKKHRILCREIVAFTLNTFDVILCFGLACGYIVHLSGVDIYSKSEAHFGSTFTEFSYTVYDSLNKVILPLGVLSTSLLLPFEDYITNDTKNDSTQNTEAADDPGESTSHNCDPSESKTTCHVSLEMEQLDRGTDEKTHLVDNKDEKHYDSFSKTCRQSVGR